jgi:hypothetical protein
MLILVIVLKILKVDDIYICELNKKVVYYNGEHSFLVALERIEHNGIKIINPVRLDCATSRLTG